MLRQRQIAQRVQARQVFHRDAEVIHHFFGNGLLQFHTIGVLHILRFLIGLAVEINDVVADFKCLSGQSHAAFHVVLTTVCRTGDDLSILRLVPPQFVASGCIDGIEILYPLLC